MPLLRDPGQAWKEAVYSRYHNGTSVRTDRYCYTEWARPDEEPYARMLYDQRLDPDENVNIASKRGMAETLLRLGRWLEEGWQGARPPT